MHTTGSEKRSAQRYSVQYKRKTKPLNIGMIGYGFMGKAHTNAYKTVAAFFYCVQSI